MKCGQSAKRFLGLFAAIAVALLSVSAMADTVTITVNGTYQYTGAAPSPTSNFALQFSIDRNPVVCGGSEGASLLCGASLPVYSNGVLVSTLGPPSLLIRNSAHDGGLALFQDDLQLNRLGFVLASSELFSGSLANPTFVDGVYAIVSAHDCDARSPGTMAGLCSYAGQGFASGDPVNNPFFDPVTFQSDDPILSGTITISSSQTPVPEPSSLLLLGSGVVGLVGRMRKRSVPSF
ncbi:MAG: hypothetical protein JWO13_3271 [Acidobacteriales bacterium]|nr:hypothetical protein [Terriglobales bacterium]